MHFPTIVSHHPSASRRVAFAVAGLGVLATGLAALLVVDSGAQPVSAPSTAVVVPRPATNAYPFPAGHDLMDDVMAIPAFDPAYYQMTHVYLPSFGWMEPSVHELLGGKGVS